MRTEADSPRPWRLGEADVLQLVLGVRARGQRDRRRVEPTELVLGERRRVGLTPRRHLVEGVDGADRWVDVVVKRIEILEAGEPVDQLHQPHAVAFRHHHP